MPRRFRLLILLWAAQLAGSPAASSEAPAPSALADFYVWEDEVPARPGVLLRQEPLEDRLVLANAARGVRILYSSESFQGKPTVVSGAAFIPKGAPPPGGWPVLAWSHGTVGVADRCAPSLHGRSERDIGYLEHWLGEGYAIVATDYEGLGTPGPHPYLHCRSEAFGNIDAMRAAAQLNLSISKRWMVMGQSQGGQGALCTAAHATKRAPELDFVGTLATAPGVSFMESYSGSHNEPDAPMVYLGVVLLNVRGMETFTPAFSAEEALSEKARSMMHRVDEACIYELIDEGARMGLTTNTTFNHVPFSKTPGIEDAVAQMEVPRTRFDRPVLIAQGTKDTMTPYAISRKFAKKLCDLGADVTYLVYPGEEHSGPMNNGRADFAPWVAARFAGEAHAKNCAEIE